MTLAKFRDRLLPAVLFSLLQATAASAADNDLLSYSPEQLLGATVTSASKKPEATLDAPAAVYVITHEDIERTGVTNIPDALRMAPGVDVAQADSNSWAINIRGFNRTLANQLLVMVDGRTVYNPVFAGTYWEAQNIPMEDIDRIEVVRGPGGTLWGANAVNGVINIITKKASDTQGNLVVAGTGNVQHDYELGQTGGRTAGGAWYRVYGQHFDNSAFDRPNGDSAHDGWDDFRTGFRMDRNNLTVSGDAYRTDTRQQSDLYQLDPPYHTVHDDHIASQGANLLAHFVNDFADGSKLSLQSFVDYSRRDEVLLRNEEDVFDADAQYDLAARGRNAITMGGGYRLTHQNIGDTTRLSISPERANRNLFNIFLQDKISLLPDKLFLILGSKAEHNDYTGFEFEPNARVEWKPHPNQTFWAAASRAVRTPSPFENELDLLDAVIPPNTPPSNLPDALKFEVVANPNFRSEQLISYEVGYRDLITPSLSVDATTFFNNYLGLDAQEIRQFTLVTPPLGAPYFLLQTDQANLMSGETQGFELASEWTAAPNWKLSGSYSYLQMFLHLKQDFFNQQGQEHQSPQNQASLRSYWDVTPTVSLDTSLNYVGKLAAFNIPSYVRADVNLGWKIRPNIKFNLTGQNLLKDKHLEFSTPADQNAAEIPRTVIARLTVHF